MSQNELFYNAEKVYQPETNSLRTSVIWRLTSILRVSPDFFIGGIQKGGTTSLFYALMQHPQVIPAKNKELFYYGTTPNYERGYGYYKQFFATSFYKNSRQKAIGKSVFSLDASTNTFDSKEAPKRILADNPNAKMIFIFRNPVERAFSHYKMTKKLGWEFADFEKALELEEKRIAEGLNHPLRIPNHNYAYQRLGYKARGLYAEKMKHWLSVFPNKNILILSSEDFFKEPVTVFNSVCDFLGIEKNRDVEFKKMNEGDSEKMNPQTHKYLSDYFKPHNEALFRLLNKKFDW